MDIGFYESLKDNYEYLEYEFKVGVIISYFFVDNGMYFGDDSVDVIMSSEYLKKLIGVDKYNLVYVDFNENVNKKKINNFLGKIGSEVFGIIIVDMMVEKENFDKMIFRIMIYSYGIVVIMFIISVFNIINNISYNLILRISEFGMLRVIGIFERGFKNMIFYEGILYGVFLSIIIIVLGFII